MLNNTTWKKIMTGALAFTLVSGVALPVLTKQTPIVQAAEATGITPFKDVPAGLYAEKHIYRLSLQQIVKGYENKATGEFTFKYNNTISQEEAVIMAIRFAGLESEVNKNQLIVFQDGFYVKEDYKPYIELAFEKGLLNREEEYAAAAAKPEEKWGAKPASREWVTKLIINTIGEEDKAQQLATAQSAFEDKAEIDSSYLGYVNAAVELGLIKGYTETKFAPKSPINRASFATILSRAQKDFPIEAAGQHYGIVTALTANSITVYEDGVEKTYSIDASTGFYSSDSDFAVEKSRIELYTEVAVIELNDQAKFIETQGSTRYIEETTAPVGRINTNEKIIYIWVNDNPVAVPYDDSIIVRDSAGNQLAITNLREDSRIKIIRDTFRATPKVISIELITEGEQATSTVTGTYVSYITSNNMITIKTDSGLVSKYLSKAPTVTIPYVKHATLDQLIANADKVVLTMNGKDEVIDISVPSVDLKTLYLPSIVSYDPAKQLVTVLDASGLKAEALFLTDATRYMINGVLVNRNHLSMNPLEWKGLTLRYVEADGKKNIVYFDMMSEVDGLVTDVNYFDEIVELQLADGTLTQLNYKGATFESLTKSNLTPLDLKKGVNVTADLSSKDGSVVNFRFYETHQATISAISTATKQVTFKLDNKTYSVLYDEAQFVDASGKTIAFTELKTNKTMIVGFSGNRIVRAIMQ